MRFFTEAKLWAALVQWVTGRPKSASGSERFTYLTRIQPIVLVILALLFVEGVVVEVVLANLLGNSVLVWLLLGVHVYALVWIAGFLGSLRTRPHTVTSAAITLRDSVFTELVRRRAAIAAQLTQGRPVRSSSGVCPVGVRNSLLRSADRRGNVEP